MASKILPNALVAVPINPKNRYSPLKKSLGFSVRSPSVASSLSIPRVSTNAMMMTELFGRRSFAIKAEAEDVSYSGEVVADAAPEEEAATAVREPRKPRIKLGDIMGILNKRAVEAADERRLTPDIRTGDVVEIKLEVPETRRRLSVYKGIVMSRQNAGIHTTIRIRRIIAGIGVEIVFPLYSPNIKEIKVVKHRKVRRARLYYLRDKLPRFSTFK